MGRSQLDTAEPVSLAERLNQAVRVGDVRLRLGEDLLATRRVGGLDQLREVHGLGLELVDGQPRRGLGRGRAARGQALEGARLVVCPGINQLEARAPQVARVLGDVGQVLSVKSSMSAA